MDVKNFSNRLSEGTAVVNLSGKFMGTGETKASGTFRPETKSPDFHLKIRIDRTQMRGMNDLLRAYGNFDVVAGLFSLYSELTVKNGQIEGYVKPLIKDLKAYDQRQDEEKGLFRKLYEGVVGEIAKLLENPSREEVATKADVSGTVENPQASTWATLVRLIQNAFFQTVLPGFERQIKPR